MTNKAKVLMSKAQIIAYTLQKLEVECHDMGFVETCQHINRALHEIGWEANDHFRKTGEIL